MPRGIYGRNPHYQFRDQDPVLDIAWYFAKASGKSLTELAEQTNLHVSTLRAWFYTKQTISPKFCSIAAYFASFGLDIHDLKKDLVKSAYHKIARMPLRHPKVKRAA